MLDPERPPLPDFIIGGAPKCGTTALFNYLDQHPGVYTTTPKEPHYFASAPLGRPVVKWQYSLEEYESLFAGREPGQVAGEGSTHYLVHAEAVVPVLGKVVPDVRLVFSLRNPVERGYSHYLFRYSAAGPRSLGGVGSGLSFEEFAKHPRIWPFGDYATGLAAFMERFGRDQVLVILMEDLRRDLPRTMRRICEHIGVDPSFEFDLESRANETGYPVFPTLMPLADRAVALACPRLSKGRRISLLRARRRWLFSPTASKPPLDPRDRAAVAGLYRSSIERLEVLLARDLSHWT